MSQRPIIVGERFGKRVVLEKVRSQSGGRTVKVQCDCGGIDEVAFTGLTAGRGLCCGRCRIRPGRRKSDSPKRVRLVPPPEDRIYTLTLDAWLDWKRRGEVFEELRTIAAKL